MRRSRLFSTLLALVPGGCCGFRIFLTANSPRLTSLTRAIPQMKCHPLMVKSQRPEPTELESNHLAFPENHPLEPNSLQNRKPRILTTPASSAAAAHLRILQPNRHVLRFTRIFRRFLSGAKKLPVPTQGSGFPGSCYAMLRLQ